VRVSFSDRIYYLTKGSVSRPCDVTSGVRCVLAYWILDSDGLPRLVHDPPALPKTTVMSEILQISIFRTDHWQNLIFMDDDGGPFVPPSLFPLVN
jgi:hypothetical protein